MRIALFGGTFNPVHNGHLLIAKAARQSHHLDRVVFMPAGEPPHKKKPRTSAQDRLKMLRLAVRGTRAFSVNDWEIRRRGKTYTYQTLEHFRKRWPKAALFFVLGADSYKDLSRWREAKRLPSLGRFLPFKRIAPYASHVIRKRVLEKRPIHDLVPPPVERYIQAHHLYQKPE